MAIRKAKVNSGFTVMLNKSMQDKSLSFEATGLLAMMLSLPDDWDIHKSWLQGQKQKCGRDKLTSMMKELIDTGYVVKRFKQKDDGRMDGVDWLVYPEPTNENRPEELEYRTTGNPASGEHDTTKNTSLQRNHITKYLAPSATPKVRDEYPDEFKWLWDNKPDREGSNPKRKAFQACNARIKQGATWRQMAEGMRRYRDYCQQSGKINTQYVMTMATFFGPDKHYEQDWKVNHEANARSGKRGSTVDEAMQRLQADIDSITGRTGGQTFDGFEVMAGDGGDLWEGMDQHCGTGAIIDADPVNRVID